MSVGFAPASPAILTLSSAAWTVLTDADFAGSGLASAITGAASTFGASAVGSGRAWTPGVSATFTASPALNVSAFAVSTLVAADAPSTFTATFAGRSALASSPSAFAAAIG